MATTAQRDHLHAIMEMLIANHKHIGYQASRPMKTFNPYIREQDAANLFAQGKGFSLDCSEMITLICRWAGLHDPSGPNFNYDGFGNSATMFGHLPQYTSPATRAHTGAIVAFGQGGADHVAMVMDRGDDPMLFSHGSSNGPIAVRLSDYLTAEPQQRPATFLDISSL